MVPLKTVAGLPGLVPECYGIRALQRQEQAAQSRTVPVSGL
jgi:hypothetical protein